VVFLWLLFLCWEYGNMLGIFYSHNFGVTFWCIFISGGHIDFLYWNILRYIAYCNNCSLFLSSITEHEYSSEYIIACLWIFLGKLNQMYIHWVFWVCSWQGCHKRGPKS
jgi:hypothetical protein